MRNSVGSPFTKRPIFELLEPRLLLSADPLGAAESLAAPAVLEYQAPINAESGSYTLRFDAASGALELLEGGNLVASRALAETSAVVIRGEDGVDDALTVDFSFGGFFALEGGIQFHGGAGGIDLLSVVGGDFVSATHTATSTGPGRSGSLAYDDGAQPVLVIDYTDLEPLDMSGSTITSLIFNLPGTDDQAILEDDGVAGNGISQIRSRNAAPTFETTTFSNTVTSLTVNLGGDSSSFAVAALPDYVNRALTINGQAGTDTVSFLADASFSSLNVTVGGAVSATSLAIGNGAGSIAAGAFSAGALSIAGGALNLDVASTIGSLSVTGPSSGGNVGGLGGSGNVTLLNGGVWNSGAISGSGVLTVAEGATLTVSGNNHFLNGKPVVNDGRIVWTGGVIDINAAASFLNRGVLELAAGATFGNAFAPNGTMVLTNAESGRIVQQAGSNVFGAGMTVNNQGTVEVAGGSVTFGGSGGTHTGSFTAAAGTTLGFSGIQNFDAGSRVAVAGTLAVSGGTVNLDTEVNLSGAVSVTTGGTLNLMPASGSFLPASLSVNGNNSVLNLAASNVIVPASVTIANAGTANLNSAVQIGALSVTGGGTNGLVGGLGGTGAVTLLAGGAHVWTSGNLSGAGTLTVASGATLTVSGATHILNAKPIVNQGRVQWSAGLIDLNGDATLLNEGEFVMAANNALANALAPVGTMVITNTGRILQQGLSASSLLNTSVINQSSGLIEVAAGALVIGGTLVQDGTVEVAGGATLRRLGGFTNNGMLSGNGSIDVGAANSLTNSGVVAPGARSGDTTGTLTITGNYVQGNAALLEIELASAAAGDFDVLAVTGTASLSDGSALHAELAGGFVPAAGERFRFMSFAARSGFFGSAELPQAATIDQADPTDLELVAGERNAAPQAADDAYATDEDATLTVAAPGLLGNDADAEQAPLSVVLVSGPANGVLVLNADGSFTYVPDADFFGTDSFTYRANDGDLDSGIATVSLTVAAVNDAPVANTDAFGVDEDGTLAASVLENDTDVEGDALSAALQDGPANGSLELNADGSFTYRPNANFFGTDSFTYRAGDGAAASEATTVTIHVGAVNDAPTAGADAYEVDGTLTVAAPGVLANDTDMDGSTLTATLVSSTENGALVFNQDGSFTYTANAGFRGTDSFTYRASDGELEGEAVTVTLSVAGQEEENHAPLVDAGPDQVVGLQDVDDHDGWRWWCGDRPEAEVTVNALFDDLDLDDTHTATINWGDGRLSSGRILEPTQTADGVVNGTHEYKEAGVYTVTVTVRDSEGNTTSDTLKVTVRKPIEKRNFDANGDDYRLNEDTVLTVNAAHGVLDNDRGPLGAALAVRVVEGPDHGTLVLNADGSFVYTPDKDFHGQDAFWYEFTDGANVSRAVEVELCVKDVPERSRPCIDWGDHWKTPWNDCFQPFGKRWR